MGFNDFSTSKFKNHEEDAEEAVSKTNKMKRQYRQFMNKRSGIHRGGGGVDL